jgi:uncharacterized protein (DUF2267 family)
MTTRHEAKAAEDRHIGFRWLRLEAGLASEADAEAVFRAVARVLAERIGKDEADHVASHLPLGLRDLWSEETLGVGEPRRLHRAQFVAAVQKRLGLERADDAEELITTVFAWLKYLAPEERSDVDARLPDDLKELWEKALLVPVGPGRRELSVRRSPA